MTRYCGWRLPWRSVRSLGGTLIYPEEEVRRRQQQQKKTLNLQRAMAAMNLPQKSFLKFDGACVYPQVCFFPVLWGVGLGCRG